MRLENSGLPNQLAASGEPPSLPKFPPQQLAEPMPQVLRVYASLQEAARNISPSTLRGSGLRSAPGRGGRAAAY